MSSGWKGRAFRAVNDLIDLPLRTKPILPAQDGNALLFRGLTSGRPFLFGRLGTTESEILGWYRRYWRTFHLAFPGEIQTRAWNNGGFFPPTSPNLAELGRLFEAAVRNSDLMVGWNIDYERRFRHDLAPRSPWVDLRAAEPYYFDDPWITALEGRRVLVVHPFAEQIAENYAGRRTKLFANPKVLPSFELRVVKAKQTLAGNTAGAASWFEVFEELKGAVASHDFDVALLGCGTYGMPLAHHIKTLGRSAVYMGGALQILFGIRGKRWEDIPDVSRFFNEHWTSVRAADKPANLDRVEGGCYW